MTLDHTVKENAVFNLDSWLINDVLDAMQHHRHLLEIVGVGDASFEAIHNTANGYIEQIEQANGTEYEKLKKRVKQYQTIMSGINA